jgi:porin
MHRVGFLLLCFCGLGYGWDGGGPGDWWGGRLAGGEWFWGRGALEERGIFLSGKWSGTYLGVVDGGKSGGGVFEEELVFGGKVDVGMLMGWREYGGLTLTGGVRWRSGPDVNQYAGASPVFNPAPYQSGMGWRLLPFYLTYTTPEVFGVPGLLTFSGGWQNPWEFFVQQPGSRLFRNNMIVSSKGLTANGVGWSSSYAAWGGLVRVEPAAWCYVQGGMYAAVPGGAATGNRGMAFAAASPAGINGLFALGEAGVLPKWGSGQLPGKLAWGGYFWGGRNLSPSGGSQQGQWGLYWQADQMVWREAGGADPKGGKSQEGLSLLSYFYFAPPAENAMPFYFHTGAIYRGVLPGRDDDEAGVVFGFGKYGDALARNEERAGLAPVHDYEGVLEFDYRCQINRWACVQPFIQYVIRPGGRGLVANATVLGIHMAVAF